MVAGIAWSEWGLGYGLDHRIREVARVVSLPKYPDRLWSPTSLLFNEYRGFFPGG
jgi:hypothetical protein